MTREEIIKNLKYTMEKHKNDNVPTFGTNISVMCKDILDYLEQEPVIDKIRAEIDKARFVDKDTRIVKNALASGLEVAMQIIDKYKGESEG